MDSQEKGKSPAELILLFQISKQVKNLSISFLEQIEDLQAEGYVFPPDKFSRIRKRILDRNGAAIRSLEELITKLNIEFKQ